MAYLVVHGRAFSHRRVAVHVARVLGGTVVPAERWELARPDAKTILVGTVGLRDVELFAPWLSTTSGVFYGVTEGRPLLSPRMRRVLSEWRLAAPSHYAAERIAEAVGAEPAVVPHAVAFDEVLAPCGRLCHSVRGAAAPAATVCFIGSNDYRKAVDVLPRLAGLLGDAARLVALTGPGLVPLDRLRRAGVIVVDKVYRVDIGDFYAACDAVVVPSRNEGYGMVVAEAAYAVGRVVVNGFPVCGEHAVRHPGVRCVEPRGEYRLVMNGIEMELWEPDVEALAEELLEALRGPPRGRGEKHLLPGPEVYEELAW